MDTVTRKPLDQEIDATGPGGMTIPKKTANEYIGNYLEINQDLQALFPKMPPGTPTDLIKKLYGSGWNGFAFKRELVEELISGGADCLLVLLGANQDEQTPPNIMGEPTIVLVGCKSSEDGSFVSTGKDPVEHPPKVYIPQLPFRNDLVFNESK